MPRSYDPPQAGGVQEAAPPTGRGLEFPPGSVVHVHVNASSNQIGASACGSPYNGGWWGGGALVPTLPGLWPLPPLSLGGVPLVGPYAGGACGVAFAGPYAGAGCGGPYAG